MPTSTPSSRLPVDIRIELNARRIKHRANCAEHRKLEASEPDSPRLKELEALMDEHFAWLEANVPLP